MKTKLRNPKIIFLLATLILCVVAFFVSFLLFNSGNALATPTKFYMRGASIRYNVKDKNDGLRFHLVANQDAYDNMAGKYTGMLIIPEYKLGNNTLDVNTEGAYNTLLNFGSLKWSPISDPVTANGESSTDKESIVVISGYEGHSEYYNTRLVVRGFVKNGTEYTYTDNTVVKSLADVALEQNVSKYLLNYEVSFFNADGSLIKNQSVKFGEKFDFPSISAGNGNIIDGWYRRIGGTSSAVWSDNYYAQSDIDRTVTKKMQFKAHVVADEYVDVTYSSKIYNKEHVYFGDPSVTYRDGFYYFISVDSNCNIYVAKSRSLEDLLHVGATGVYGQLGVKKVYTSGSSQVMAQQQLWAPELTYIRGKWYIYISAIPYGQTYIASRMRMYVLECESQDPTGTYKTPVKLAPSSMADHYGIDGHAFEYKGQLYYVFSGQNGEEKAQLYMCSMSSPTFCNNDVARINLESKTNHLKEGPCTVVDGNDLYLVFSMGSHNGDYAGNSDATKDYHLCYYKLTGTNPLNKSHWTDKGICLQRDTSKDIHTVGHNHFFYNADGTLWTSYHGHVGTTDSGSYLDHRMVMVQPVTVSNGELNFGGVQDVVTINNENGGLKRSIYNQNNYMIDCSNDESYCEWSKSYGLLWKNDGGDFTVTTTITRVSGTAQYCAGVILYERSGDKTNRLLIGVEQEGNIFLCKDYSRRPFNYKYVGWLWGNEGVAKLTVNYTASNKTFKITVSNPSGSKTQTHTYTVAQINALVSDPVGGETKAYNLAFTGNFYVGFGGHLNKCTFTDVTTQGLSAIIQGNGNGGVGWNPEWGDSWNPYS